MGKIAVIGDRESVLAFMAVGFRVFIADDILDAAQALRRAASEQYAVIFVTEDIASQIEDEIARYKNDPLPAVIAIPGKGGATGYGIDNIRKSVERAVGTDILFKEQ